MKRHGWKFTVGIILAILVFLWLLKAPAMSWYLTDKVNVPVSVRTISMWPKTTTIRHFRITNPSGFKTESALHVDKTKIHYTLHELFSNPSQIDLITLDNVILNIELLDPLGKNNNWSAIGAGMPTDEHERAVKIRKIILTNLTVNVSGRGAKALGVSGTKHFARMEFNNIDSREGFPTKELIRQIFQGAGLQKFLEGFLNPAKTIKDTILSPFKLFGKQSANPSE